MNNQLIIADIAVRQDSEGRYNLNDLHKAAGADRRFDTREFLDRERTQKLIEELESQMTEIPVNKKPGRYGGTFVVKDLVYAYAMWISPAFQLKVTRAYDQLQTEGVAVADHAADDLIDNPLDYMEKLLGQARKLKSERDQAQQRVSTYQKVTSKHSHTLNRFIRTLPGVNSQKIKHDLMFYGYLYRTSQTYKRYARFDHLFQERIDDEYGTVQIVPTEQGKQLLIDLYERGALTMKKSHQ